MNVGFIGLGIMGMPMARNLLRAGFELTVFNRTRAKAESVVREGAVLATSPKEVAERSDVIITMVTESTDVREVILGPDGVIQGARPGAIVIDMSTISPRVTREIASELKKRDVAMLDAPVSGGDAGARAATLSIMVGGETEHLSKCLPILQAMGSKITHIGDIGAGQICKLINQTIVSINLLAVAEALVFAKKSQVDPLRVIEAVSGGAAGSWQLNNLGEKMVVRDFEPGFMIKLLQKDLRLVLEESNELHLPTLGVGLVHQLLRKAEADGYGSEGTQALITVLESLSSTNT